MSSVCTAGGCSAVSSKAGWSRADQHGFGGTNGRRFSPRSRCSSSWRLVDVALGARAVLIELLVAGPLIAATAASPRQTADRRAAGARVSRSLSALVSDAFGSAEHLTRCRAWSLWVARCPCWSRIFAPPASATRHGCRSSTTRPGCWLSRTLSTRQPHICSRPSGARSAGSSATCGLEDGGGRTAPWWAPGTPREPSPPQPACTGLRRRSGRAAARRGSAAARSAREPGVAFPVLDGDGCVARARVLDPRGGSPNGELAAAHRRAGAPDRRVHRRASDAREARSRRARPARAPCWIRRWTASSRSTTRAGVVEFSAAAERIFGHDAEERRSAASWRSWWSRPRCASATEPPCGAASRPARAPILGRRIELIGHARRRQRVSRRARHQPGRGRRAADVHRRRQGHHRRRRAEAERDELLRLEQVARLDATQARDQLEAILRGVADAVTAQAPDGRLLFANDAAVTMLGYDSSEALLSAPINEIVERFEMLDESGEPVPLETPAGPAGARDRGAAARRSSASVCARPARSAGRRSRPRPSSDREGRRGHGDQRDRGHQRAQALRAGAAVPRREQRGARVIARPPTSCCSRWRRSRCPSSRTGAPSTCAATDGGIERAALAHADPEHGGVGQRAQRPLSAGPERGAPACRTSCARAPPSSTRRSPTSSSGRPPSTRSTTACSPRSECAPRSSRR